jgi:hypothetical protein
MLSLNVAAERAELAKIERQIVIAKQDIRTLQTELGTRGRLEQLEQWNAEVLALSAPSSAQFLESEVVLARFETREPTIEDRAEVTMAAAVASPQPGVKLAPADYAAAAAARAGEKQPKNLVHQAAFVAPLRQARAQKANAVIQLVDSRTRQPALIKASAAKPAAALHASVTKMSMSAAPKPAARKAERAPDSIKLAAVSTKPVAAKKAPRVPAPTSTGMLDDALLKELGETSRTEKADAGAR